MIAMFISIQLSYFSYHYYFNNMNNSQQQGDEYYENYEKSSLLFNTILQEYQSHPFTLTKHAACRMIIHREFLDIHRDKKLFHAVSSHSISCFTVNIY